MLTMNILTLLTYKCYYESHDHGLAWLMSGAVFSIELVLLKFYLSGLPYKAEEKFLTCQFFLLFFIYGYSKYKHFS